MTPDARAIVKASGKADYDAGPLFGGSDVGDTTSGRSIYGQFADKSGQRGAERKMTE